MTGESEAPSANPHHELIESTNQRLDRLTHPLGPGGDGPLEVFPPEVAVYIATSAVSARVPQAMVALPFLVFTGATIGRQLKLHVGNGWMESPTLWAALVAPTGSGKTPAIEWARRRLDRLQEAAALGGTWKSTNPDLTFATGHTIDSLARDLVQNPGLILVRDELHSLVRTIGQHGRRLDRLDNQWLTLATEPPDVEIITGYYREIGTRLRLQVTPDPEAAVIWKAWFNVNLEQAHAARKRLAGHGRKPPSQVAFAHAATGFRIIH